MALDDMIPEDDREPDAEDLSCPACGASGDDINVMNRSLFNCQNDDCRVFNFGN